MALKIYIAPDLSCKNIIRYVFQIISENKKVDFDFVFDVSQSDLKVTSDSSSDFPVSKLFYQKLSENKFSFENYFEATCMVRDENGKEDLLSTIFYCVNSIQEYNAASSDSLGRFEFKKSYQAKFNSIEENYVQRLIDKVCTHPKLSVLTNSKRKSKIFLTHDIDTIHGAWKEDGFFALKKLKFGKVFLLMLNQALNKPDWLNMDKIMKIEDEKGFRSTFYWLLHKDKANSDYNFKSKSVQENVNAIQQSEWENGLHKSLRSTSFQDELKILNLKTKGNRFHYLNFQVPNGYSQIEEAGLKLDTSLGFSEQWGFRNNYGLPFMPYNLKEDRVFDFSEVPMQVMDRTFFSKRIAVSEIKKTLIDWFEKNKYDCVFSINFHNNFFSELKYGGYVDLYKSLLSYFRESGFEPTTQTELVNEFYKPEKFNLN